MSENKSKEEVANLVKELAAKSTDEQLDNLGYLTNHLHLREQFPNWDRENWYEFLVKVRQEKHKTEHNAQTAECIFSEMPYYAKEVAQVALKNILEAEKAENARNLYRIAAAETSVIYLWTMFNCCKADIKSAATKYSKEDNQISVTEYSEHKDLFRFIEIMRETLWDHGEVFKLSQQPEKETIEYETKAELFGRLIDAVEDFLADHGVTAKELPNEERDEEEDAALIYGSDYDDLANRFAIALGISRDDPN